mgnify:CR=1 FL=1
MIFDDALLRNSFVRFGNIKIGIDVFLKVFDGVFSAHQIGHTNNQHLSVDQQSVCLRDDVLQRLHEPAPVLDACLLVTMM